MRILWIMLMALILSGCVHVNYAPGKAYMVPPHDLAS